MGDIVFNLEAKKINELEAHLFELLRIINATGLTSYHINVIVKA